jgi:hypothetical protein
MEPWPELFRDSVMTIAFLYSEHGFNLAILGLTLAYGLVGVAIRLSRQGSEAFAGLAFFAGIKLVEDLFLAVALTALLAVTDGFVAARLAHHPAYAFAALFGAVVASIDLLVED